MNPDELAECLDLLGTADTMLLEGGELLAAAHLSMVIEILSAKLASARQAKRLCGA